MANIVFTWETGAGLGHVVHYLHLLRSLVARGHRVSFILRDLSKASQFLDPIGVSYLQAPVRTSPIENYFKTPCTFAHVLHNIGFDRSEALFSHVLAWRSLFELLNPDIVVFDHSPTAVLASHGLPFKKILSGIPFAVPGDIAPLPNLRFWEAPQDDILCKEEQKTLEVINKVLSQMDCLPLPTVASLFRGPRKVFTCLPELDAYDRSKDDDIVYCGSFATGTGLAPEWPSGDKPKVFAYLKPFAALPALFAMLEKLKMPSLIYMERLDPAVSTQFASASMKFVDRPVNIADAAEQCDYAILNGTLNTSVQMLLAGKPCLHLPIFLEQTVTAKRIEDFGVGVAAFSLKPEEILLKLHMLLSSTHYAEAANDISRKYAYLSLAWQTELFIKLIEDAIL